MTTAEPAFRYAHTVETDVPAAAIWARYDDVTTWPQWDGQAEAVSRDGPFAAGTTGTMKFAGQGPLSYRLTRVPGREFVDETPVAGLIVRVSHLQEPLAGGRLRVTYAAQVEGPPEQARQIGPMITAHFPATMASLIALARTRAAGG